MKLCNHAGSSGAAIGLLDNDRLYDLGPGSIDEWLASGTDLGAAIASRSRGAELDAAEVRFLPVVQRPPKIVCIGLNYIDHAAESPYKNVPDYPAMFPRFSATLTGHGQPIVRPRVSSELDFEGELAVIIGKGGRHVTRENALDHVAGYSIFNDASLRDYQFKSPQWTAGKNFAQTGPLGPYLVTPDELPAGADGLDLQTLLNGEVVQHGNTRDMIFKVADLIFHISEILPLEPGDVIAAGTPAGVGFARTPPLFMKHGDVCEVRVEGIGSLVNTIADETSL